MASSSNAAPPSQEFAVRVRKETNKVYGVMKFNPNNKVDFTKSEGVKIERENNLRDYKVAHNLDTMPKFGAGSEFGRDMKEEARRKKYGIYMKAYNVEDQPWLLKMGSGKTSRNFKGTKEGGIQDNASYYIFTQCPDGAFEAFPIDEWYSFNPQIKYKHLSAEEAEEQYSKREQIMNYHSIMVQKRIRDDKDDTKDLEEEKKNKKKKAKSKDFLLTDMDDWAILSDGSDEGSGEEAILPKKQGKKKLTKKSGNKKNSDDEAVEESDENDEGREVDYMTDTDSEDEEMFADKERDGKTKYEEKGVEDEEALQKLIESEEEVEEEKETSEPEDNNEENEEGNKKGSGSDSSSSSESDSDPDKESTFSSALFMPVRKSGMESKKDKDSSDKKDKKSKKEKKKGKELKRKGSFSSEGSSATNSRSATPTVAAGSSVKEVTDGPAAKKPKLEPTTYTGVEGVSEETVRRYLMRKPMTTKDLLQKFKNLNLPKEKLVTTIAEILKKLNPEKNKIKNKLFLFIKQ